MAGSGNLDNFSVIVESKMLLALFSYFIGRRCYVKEIIQYMLLQISFLWVWSGFYGYPQKLDLSSGGIQVWISGSC